MNDSLQSTYTVFLYAISQGIVQTCIAIPVVGYLIKPNFGSWWTELADRYSNDFLQYRAPFRLFSSFQITLLVSDKKWNLHQLESNLDRQKRRFACWPRDIFPRGVIYLLPHEFANFFKIKFKTFRFEANCLLLFWDEFHHHHHHVFAWNN